MAENPSATRAGKAGEMHDEREPKREPEENRKTISPWKRKYRNCAVLVAVGLGLAVACSEGEHSQAAKHRRASRCA